MELRIFFLIAGILAIALGTFLIADAGPDDHQSKPFGTGLIIIGVIVVGLSIWAIVYSYTH